MPAEERPRLAKGQAVHESAKATATQQTALPESAEESDVGTGHHTNQEGTMSADGFIEGVVFSQPVVGSGRPGADNLRKARAAPMTLEDAVAAVAAAQAASEPLYRAFEAAETEALALRSTHNQAIKEAVEAVQPPEDLLITLSGASVVKTVVVHTLANGETREIVISDSLKAALCSAPEIERQFAGDPERRERALAALAKWEDDKKAAEAAATPRELMRAESSHQRTDRRWQAALRTIEKAADAILDVPATTPAEVRAKLKAYGECVLGVPRRKRVKLFEFLSDEEARNALEAVYRDLGTLNLRSEPPEFGPDAELVGLAHQFQANREEFYRLWGETPQPLPTRVQDRLTELTEDLQPLIDRSYELQARSVRGLWAKALMAEEYAPEVWTTDYEDLEHKLARSLIADVHSMAELPGDPVSFNRQEVSKRAAERGLDARGLFILGDDHDRTP